MRRWHRRSWQGGLKLAQVCAVVAAGISCDGGAGHADSAPKKAPPPAQSKASTKGAPPAAAGVTHTVGEGETLWDIAHAYGVSLADVMAANGLDERRVRKLSKGSQLKIPGVTAVVKVPVGADKQAALHPSIDSLPPLTDGAYHMLAEGETVWDLARTYEVSVDDIIARNRWTDDDLRKLRPGSAVVIPGVTQAKVKTTKAAQRRGIVHTMELGETVWDLASAFQVSVGEIMSANALDSARITALREGTKLFIPGVTEDKSGRVRRDAQPSQGKATALAKRLGLGTRRAASELVSGRVTAAWVRAAGGSPRLAGTLRWPVANGHYVRGYGSGKGGYHLATDIMGDIGWNVRAAAPGIVGYAGKELKGFGNVVMVIHPGGWVTLYGHNSVNFVVAGQRVERGSVLAEVGSTGVSRGPHVHFELMFDGKNCDPTALFRPGIRYRNRKMARNIQPATWSNPKKRPAQVACGTRRHFAADVMDEDPVRDAEFPLSGEGSVHTPAASENGTGDDDSTTTP